MKNEFVQRISNWYVTDKGVQVFIKRASNTITRLNREGMTFHYKDGSELFVHKCIDQINTFIPYNNIASYNTGRGIYDREFFDFNKVYIEISDGHILENYAVKDKESALIATKLLLPEKSNTLYCNRKEVIKMIEDNKDNIYELNGRKTILYGTIIPEEKEMLERYKRRIKQTRKFEEKLMEYSDPNTYVSLLDRFGIMYYDKDAMDNVYDILVNNITLDNINREHHVISKNNMVIVQSDVKDISSIKSLDIYLTGTDKYKVEVYNYPITFFNYDYIKQLEGTNLVKTREPKISKRLNPQISPAIINKGKKMVKRIKRAIKS